jgi:hypothetical protein
MGPALPALSWSTGKWLSLKDIKTDVHCDTCKIDFTVNFDRYVELTFRPNPAVRRVEVQSYCIGSPHWTPHVVAQQLLPAGDKRELCCRSNPAAIGARARVAGFAGR